MNLPGVKRISSRSSVPRTHRVELFLLQARLHSRLDQVPEALKLLQVCCSSEAMVIPSPSPTFAIAIATIAISRASLPCLSSTKQHFTGCSDWVWEDCGCGSHQHHRFRIVSRTQRRWWCLDLTQQDPFNVTFLFQGTNVDGKHSPFATKWLHCLHEMLWRTGKTQSLILYVCYAGWCISRHSGMGFVFSLSCSRLDLICRRRNLTKPLLRLRKLFKCRILNHKCLMLSSRRRLVNLWSQPMNTRKLSTTTRRQFKYAKHIVKKAMIQGKCVCVCAYALVLVYIYIYIYIYVCVCVYHLISITVVSSRIRLCHELGDLYLSLNLHSNAKAVLESVATNESLDSASPARLIECIKAKLLMGKLEMEETPKSATTPQSLLDAYDLQTRLINTISNSSTESKKVQQQTAANICFRLAKVCVPRAVH